jgi:carbonic anhydrase/acetyltransferase-like protein (isoleucine patch superfamily)
MRRARASLALLPDHTAMPDHPTPSAIHPDAFIHPSAEVWGDVHLGAEASVWPTAVIRGDVERITIGARSNVQDGAVVHADPGVPTVIGTDCVIGHRAIVHGTTLEDGVLVGMGAILLNRVRVGRGSVIAAGAVITEGTEVPPGSLVVGVPGKVVRTLDTERQAAIVANAGRYVALARAYRAGQVPRRRSAPAEPAEGAR